MGNENTILTALGLDTSQFEDGTNRATAGTYRFAEAASKLQSQLESIPIVGGAISLAFFGISNGIAEATLQGREFARIMRTDVTGSLEGSIGKIEDINALLKDMKQGSFARALGDLWKNMQQSDESLLAGGGTAQDVREKQIAALEDQRKKTVESLVPLYESLAKAQSTAVTRSQLATNLEAIKLDAANKRAEVEARATKMFGPNAEDRTEYQKKAVAAEIDGINKVESANSAAAKMKHSQAMEEMRTAITKANLELTGNARLQAMEDIKLANKKKELSVTEEEWNQAVRDHAVAVVNLSVEDKRYELLLASLENEKESAKLQLDGNARLQAQQEIHFARQKELAAVGDDAKKTAQADLEIAYIHAQIAETEYGYAVRTSQLQTQHQEQLITGQNRAAKQTEIRLRYEVQIAQAMQHENKELAELLKKQEAAAKFEEQLRLYHEGAGGRAAERLAEQRARHDARVVASQQKSREANQARKKAGGLSGGGLSSGGLTSGNPASEFYDHMVATGHMADTGHMDAPGNFKHNISKPAPVTVVGLETVFADILNALKQ